MHNSDAQDASEYLKGRGWIEAIDGLCFKWSDKFLAQANQRSAVKAIVEPHGEGEL